MVTQAHIYALKKYNFQQEMKQKLPIYTFFYKGL